jgi:DNA-binding transcriptional LysR family regulator
MDIATLRSFRAIAETGSMTHAASRVNMTQSAISMQIKRLESSLDLSLFDRTPKGMVTTASGDQLLQYAKNILAVNDEAWSRLTASEYEGELSLGVPTDIINPYIPQILSRFLRDYPRIQVKLHAAHTRELLDQFSRGVHDVLLTTEREPGKGGEILSTQRLVWIGAIGGTAWKKSPLPLSFTKSCAFRRAAIATLDETGMDWVETVTAEDDSAGSAMVAVDLGVKAELEHSDHTGREVIKHNGQLPELPDYSIVLYHASHDEDRGMADILSEYITRAFA